MGWVPRGPPDGVVERDSKKIPSHWPGRATCFWALCPEVRQEGDSEPVQRGIIYLPAGRGNGRSPSCPVSPGAGTSPDGPWDNASPYFSWSCASQSRCPMFYEAYYPLCGATFLSLSSTDPSPYRRVDFIKLGTTGQRHVSPEKTISYGVPRPSQGAVFTGTAWDSDDGPSHTGSATARRSEPVTRVSARRKEIRIRRDCSPGRAACGERER